MLRPGRYHWTASLLTATALLILAAGQALAFSSFENQFHTRYGTTGSAIDSCALCHPGGSSSAPTVNSYGQDWVTNGMNSAAFAAIEGLDSDRDGFTNIDEITARTFPGDANSKPAVIGPVCTDSDGDGFAVEGGSCGPVDCNDKNAAVRPNASEACTDSIDNDCDGLIDRADPNAVSCPPVCIDADNDGYSVTGGACGPVDCNDSNAGVNPGAVENCTDKLDNNCNSLIDEADPNAQDCPIVQPPAPACTDADSDGFSIEGGSCGPTDCNDANPLVNPNSPEDCIDGIDNNCNGLVDAADPQAEVCPAGCSDADQDGYAVEGGNCGPVDCNDNNRNINPASAEDCTDGLDNDCDGLIDRTDPNAQSCPVICTDVDQDGFAIEGGTCGPVDPNDSNAAIVPSTGNGTPPPLTKSELKLVKKYQKKLSDLNKQLLTAQKKLASQQAKKQKTEKTEVKIERIEAQIQQTQTLLDNLQKKGKSGEKKDKADDDDKEQDDD